MLGAEVLGRFPKQLTLTNVGYKNVGRKTHYFNNDPYDRKRSNYSNELVTSPVTRQTSGRGDGMETKAGRSHAGPSRRPSKSATWIKKDSRSARLES